MNGSYNYFAPFTGAWIETRQTLGPQSAFYSLPSRERGLKPIIGGAVAGTVGSLPSRERGLKRIDIDQVIDISLFAPFTGAWIETEFYVRNALMIDFRSLHGSVD